jgi:hypothetical protein
MVRIMQQREEPMDNESDSDESYDENPFDSNEVVCIGIDSGFCKLAFGLKQLLYSKLIYEGDENKNESQDLNQLTNYEKSLDSIHGVLYGLFTNQNSPEEPIPKEVETSIPPEVRELFQKVYQQSCTAYKNNDANTRDVYRIFIHNVFHVYPYEMSSSQVDDE